MGAALGTSLVALSCATRPTPAPLETPITTVAITSASAPVVAPRAPSASASASTTSTFINLDPFLIAKPLSATSRRTLLATAGEARWTEDGPVIGTGTGTLSLLNPIATLAVAEQNDRYIRVVLASHGVVLAPLVRRENARRVPFARTTLAHSASTSAPNEDQPGVTLAPGAPIELLELVGNTRHVRVSDRTFVFNGWIAESALSETYDEAPPSKPQQDAVALEGAPIFGSIGGAEIARLAIESPGKPTFAIALEVKGAATSGHYAVVIDTPHATVRGFMKTTDVHTNTPLPLFGIGSGEGWGTSARTIRLLANTRLYASKGGPQIGLTLKDVRAEPIEQRDGWVRIRTYVLLWGHIEAWVTAPTE